MARSASTSGETGALDRYPVKQLLEEYKDLAVEVRKDFNAGLLQGATVVALAAALTTAADKGSWPLAGLASLVMLVLAAFAVRNMAEYHAMGGYKRAMEETLHRLLGPTPWVWESAVVPTTRNMAVKAPTWFFGIIALAAVAVGAFAATKSHLDAPWGSIAPGAVVALGLSVALAFHGARKLSESACRSAFVRLACLDCRNAPLCPGAPDDCESHGGRAHGGWRRHGIPLLRRQRNHEAGRTVQRPIRELPGWRCQLPDCWEARKDRPALRVPAGRQRLDWPSLLRRYVELRGWEVESRTPPPSEPYILLKGGVALDVRKVPGVEVDDFTAGHSFKRVRGVVTTVALDQIGPLEDGSFPLVSATSRSDLGLRESAKPFREPRASVSDSQ